MKTLLAQHIYVMGCVALKALYTDLRQQLGNYDGNGTSGSTLRHGSPLCMGHSTVLEFSGLQHMLLWTDRGAAPPG